MLKSATILAAGLLAFSVSSASGEDVSAETVIATVDGVEITLGQMIITRAQLPQQYQQLPDAILWEGIIDQLVQQQLIAAQLTEEPTRVRMALEVERRTLMAGEAVTALTDAAVTEEALQAAYDARFADMEPVTEFNASHILVDTEEEALAVKARVDGGAEFAQTAREVSTGPSGPSGGELGWFGPGMMVPEFELAVGGMEVGAVSDPIQTQFGWHVIKLNDSRLQSAPDLESIREELIAEIQQEIISRTLADLTAVAEISRPEAGDYDPAILNDLGLLDN